MDTDQTVLLTGLDAVIGNVSATPLETVMMTSPVLRSIEILWEAEAEVDHQVHGDEGLLAKF